jgi:hypothetical protein
MAILDIGSNMANTEPPRWSTEPLVRIVVLFALSVAAATLFYFLGGSLASASGNSDTILGFSFKATGAIGGFVIIFALSVYSMSKFKDNPPVLEPLDVLKFRVRGHPSFSRNDNYAVVCTISPQSGADQELRPYATLDQQHLIFELKKIHHDDSIRVKITNQQDVSWEISSFNISDQFRIAERRGQVSELVDQQANPVRKPLDLSAGYAENRGTVGYPAGQLKTVQGATSGAANLPPESIVVRGERHNVPPLGLHTWLVPNSPSERPMSGAQVTNWQRLIIGAGPQEEQVTRND